MVHSKIQPVGDRILVQFDPESEQTRRGVIIPDSAKEISQEATVIALGSGRRSADGTHIPFEVQIGDRVLLAKYTGAEVRLEDLKYTLVREEDILGRIK